MTEPKTTPGTLPSPIAIDGPAASGKTTLGRALAERFGYRFLDTGLMYRAFTLAALRNGARPDDEAACGALAERLNLTVDATTDTRILLDGKDVTAELRAPEVEANVSAYSAIAGVRTALVKLQRTLAEGGRWVLAGRDIGTVVLPGAPLKFYLEASPEARAERRARQAREWGQTQTPEQSQGDIIARDQIDSTRKTSPLEPAADAIRIDTTNLTLEQVLQRAFSEVEARAGSASATREQAPPAAAKRPAQSAGRRSPQSEAKGDGGTVARLLAPIRKRLQWSTFVPPFYWFCVHGLRVILWVLGRWKAPGREHIPASGPLIVVSNHLNNADPPILASGIAKRRIHFMAKIELFRMPFGIIVRLYGAFPVRRFDADMAAMLHAERLLKRGEVIGMFPEGTRSRSGKLGKPHPGTAVIALRTGAPVLPCAIVGTEQLRNPLNVLRKPRIEVRIGEPIQVEAVRRPTEEQVSELTNRIFDAIRALLPAQYLDAYTDPDGGNSSRQ